MKKRGLSTVITSLILILLVLVAIGIVWSVIQNILVSEGEEVDLGKFTLDLEIESVVVDVDNNEVDVTVKRNPGKGELIGLKFVIEDGVSLEVINNETDIRELEEKTFLLENYDSLVKKISIAPIFTSKPGKNKTGNIVDTLKLSNKKVLENAGVVSWWGFEGNPNDEIGNNHGTHYENPTLVPGKFGQAYEFDGSNYIQVDNNASLNFNDAMTIKAWFNPSNVGGGKQSIVGKKQFGGYSLRINNGIPGEGLADFIIDDFGGSATDIYRCPGTTTLENNVWYHIVGVKEGTEIRIYINGEHEETTPGVALGTSNYTLFIAGDPESLSEFNTPGTFYYPYYGKIDEVMIFNRALSENEVEALYNLDLS